ncbi:MAG TPA: sulfite exporter TauE/SafE family protein [Streptosporangiales bacterium]
MNTAMAVGSFVVGLVVGLTGMGGGALMTPMLVLFFGVQPLAAVSSDLVASVFMKPFGGLVHLRRRTVDLRLVKWLCVGSVPSAFAGALLIKLFGHGEQVQHGVQIALGVALLIAAAGIAAKAYTSLRESRSGRPRETSQPIVVRPLPTVAVGVVGGLVVGLTSVGSGSLIIVALLALYPTLRAGRLVGTDLVQAVPLVIAAALGHVLFGDFQFAVTASVLVGAIPGVLLGALGSSRLPGGVIRRVLVVVLVASALKMLGAGNVALLVAVPAVALAVTLGWMAIRRGHGLPALPRRARPRTPGERDPATSASG